MFSIETLELTISVTLGSILTSTGYLESLFKISLLLLSPNDGIANNIIRAFLVRIIFLILSKE